MLRTFSRSRKGDAAFPKFLWGRSATPAKGGDGEVRTARYQAS